MTAAVLLIVGGLYETADRWYLVQLNTWIFPAVEALLRPFRSYAGFFEKCHAAGVRFVGQAMTTSKSATGPRVALEERRRDRVNVTGYAGTFTLTVDRWFARRNWTP